MPDLWVSALPDGGFTMTPKRANGVLGLHWMAFPDPVPPGCFAISFDREMTPEEHAYGLQLAQEISRGAHVPIRSRVWADGCWQELFS